jgi:hypothetical protein
MHIEALESTVFSRLVLAVCVNPGFDLKASPHGAGKKNKQILKECAILKNIGCNFELKCIETHLHPLKSSKMHENALKFNKIYNKMHLKYIKIQ